LVPAAVILLSWLFSPAIAAWLGRPLVRREPRLAAGDVLFLRALARRTWAFFDSCVTAADHWLPPDNFQEHPAPALAHRTSPTNMGLALLANLAAYDFGYIPSSELVVRTARALATMKSMQRYEGHFYNWYDTLTLEPLAPRYVSAVDSGNLAGHLMTLAPGAARARRREGVRCPLVRRPCRHAARARDRAGRRRSRDAPSLARRAGDRVRLAARDAGRGEPWLHRIEPGIVRLASHVAAHPVGDAAFWSTPSCASARCCKPRCAR
jgi:hypothetical protein